MTGKNSVEVPHMRQRTILQHLSLVDWKLVNRLPVSAGEMTLTRLLVGSSAEVKTTYRS